MSILTTANDSSRIPVALTIAGSDSGGGAGIQTDLRTFHAYGVFGCAAITALTFQNPLEVRGVEAASPEALHQQIRAVEDTMQIRAAKTGMLFSAPLIRAAAESLQETRHLLIVDPVMVATSGARLLQPDAQEALKNDFLPLADWITPNVPEAEILCGRPLHTASDRAQAAQEIAERYQAAVILKGGHVVGDNLASDLICCEGRLYRLSAPRLAVHPHADHGTGCTFSAALTAGFALNLPWRDVLIRAKAYVSGSLAESRRIDNSAQEIWGMYPPENPERYYSNIHLETL